MFIFACGTLHGTCLKAGIKETSRMRTEQTVQTGQQLNLVEKSLSGAH